MIKVLVTGAFSTGKSTLVESLASGLRKHRSVSVVPDVARQCPFALNKAQGEKGTLWLLTKQILSELEISEIRPDVLLCDRGIPDIMAHLEECRKRGSAGILADFLRPFLVQWCRTYDLVLVSKIDSCIAPVADNLRLYDAEFRAQMEAFSDIVLADVAPHAITLPLIQRKRLAEALDHIEREFKQSGA